MGAKEMRKELSNDLANELPVHSAGCKCATAARQRRGNGWPPSSKTMNTSILQIHLGNPQKRGNSEATAGQRAQRRRTPSSCKSILAVGSRNWSRPLACTKKSKPFPGWCRCGLTPPPFDLCKLLRSSSRAINSL